MAETEDTMLNTEEQIIDTKDINIKQATFEMPAEGALHACIEQLLTMYDEHRGVVGAHYAEIERVAKVREDALRHQLQKTYEQQVRLTKELRMANMELEELHMKNADLEKKVMDYQQQVEKRNFNVELRKQYDEQQAELEDLKANMNRKVRERVKDSTDKIYNQINALIKKQLDEVLSADGSHDWNKQRKLLLGIFWRIPDIGGPLDAAGDEMIESTRRAREQADQKQSREEELAERTIEAIEKQADKPAGPIHMDVKDGGFAIGNIEELKGIANPKKPKEIEE